MDQSIINKWLIMWITELIEFVMLTVAVADSGVLMVDNVVNKSG